eukprot:537769_1
MSWHRPKNYKPLPIPPKEEEEKSDEKTEYEAFVEVSKNFLNDINGVADTNAIAVRSSSTGYKFLYENSKAAQKLTEQCRATIHDIEVKLAATQKVLKDLELW